MGIVPFWPSNTINDTIRILAVLDEIHTGERLFFTEIWSPFQELLESTVLFSLGQHELHTSHPDHNIFLTYYCEWDTSPVNNISFYDEK